MNAFRVVAALVFACVILGASYDFTLNRTTPLARFDPATKNENPIPIGHTLLSAGMMLLGIFAAALRSSLQNKSQIESVRSEIALTFRSAQFIKSLVASPIVFSAIYLATKEQPDWVLASIFAFENGFFCDTILRTHEKKLDE